ncbi:hypothetical protein M1E08_11185 [Erwinia sp. PK3-005]|uniref:DUF805 domain-containing protein n=1 Tax=Mixta hanseatica TaxID=2872648 RepID=A0ABY4RCI9_9GAMM|nr:hypothetical protein [Mixta hanseatica]UQY45900.1 hypothetical protein K6958_09805 [Mixta hanseatica]
MSAFFHAYKKAFNRDDKLSLGEWMNFTLKSLIIFMLLFLAFTVLQYFILIKSPLIDALTVSAVRLTSLCGFTLLLVGCFTPSILYAIKAIVK